MLCTQMVSWNFTFPVLSGIVHQDYRTGSIPRNTAAAISHSIIFDTFFSEIPTFFVLFLEYKFWLLQFEKVLLS